MIKSEIIQEIANKTGFDKPVVSAIVEALMATMKESMVGGNNIHLRGFGSFLLKTRAEKKGRNISMGTELLIPAHIIPTFKPAEEFVTVVKTKVKLS